MQTLSPQDAFDRFMQGAVRLIDIRETDEYAEIDIPGSHLIPLSIIARHPLKDADAPDKPIVFFCRSGNRTAKAEDLLGKLAGGVDAYKLDGGILAWEKAGLPVERGSSAIPLFRQIQIAAGSLVLLGTIVGSFWAPAHAVEPPLTPAHAKRRPYLCGCGRRDEGGALHRNAATVPSPAWRAAP